MSKMRFIPLEESGDIIADFVWDIMLSMKQYWSGNRVMVLKPRLSHHERMVVQDRFQTLYTLNGMMAYWIAESRGAWLLRMFKDGIPNQVRDIHQAVLLLPEDSRQLRQYCDHVASIIENMTLEEFLENSTAKEPLLAK